MSYAVQDLQYKDIVLSFPPQLPHYHGPNQLYKEPIRANQMPQSSSCCWNGKLLIILNAECLWVGGGGDAVMFCLTPPPPL